MSFQEEFEKLSAILGDAKNVLIVTHPRPDADALGSAFAMRNYLEKTYPLINATIYTLDQPSNQLAKLFADYKVKNEFNYNDFDSFIFLDRGSIFYELGFDKELLNPKYLNKLVNIDHHNKGTLIPDALNIVDSSASATCEIIYDFLKHVSYKLDFCIAQFLLNGIFADTGGFRHSNTSPKTLEIASLLMRNGASITKVNRVLFANKSLDTLKLWGIALERAQLNKKTGMAVSFITEEDLKKCNATIHDLGGISEMLNTISGSKFSLVLSERPNNKVKASLRSDEHKKIDVSEIARQFKGGGHKLSSGFEIDGKLKLIDGDWVIE
jgi:bifunctional oligoribonuclease and PAP phosphatase NrnA